MTTHELLSLIAFVMAQLADVLTTLRALRHGKREGNPIVAWAMRRFGRYGWIVVKLVITCLAAWLALRAGLPIIVWAVAGLTALVALHNYRLVR
ncbi:DUF5658 family protein [Palleronia caenipelagi]|uniref:DUF5658 domain-containing protein n=1 Tax=Palleronia caenipelagi TaxID=2489174 RepID=A0A547PS24_9RHOB|nr:DUF5658 family protein [Palleronia caenipelagi]TRD16956.1 hypothetical protein FEV53_13550 [Palleronia caenipelagi]